jgi:hypothetical protein
MLGHMLRQIHRMQTESGKDVIVRIAECPYSGPAGGIDGRQNEGADAGIHCARYDGLAILCKGGGVEMHMTVGELEHDCVQGLPEAAICNVGVKIM